MDFLSDLHPKIVHFPVALLMVYALLEILGVIFKKEFLSKAAHLFLFLGVLGAFAAVLTGHQAEEAAELLEKKGAIIQFSAIGEHENYATITLWFFTVALALRTFLFIKKKFVGIYKYIFIAIALAGAFLIFETADHGGKLVYKYGIGTELKELEITE